MQRWENRRDIRRVEVQWSNWNIPWSEGLDGFNLPSLVLLRSFQHSFCHHSSLLHLWKRCHCCFILLLRMQSMTGMRLFFSNSISCTREKGSTLRKQLEKVAPKLNLEQVSNIFLFDSISLSSYAGIFCHFLLLLHSYQNLYGKKCVYFLTKKKVQRILELRGSCNIKPRH